MYYLIVNLFHPGTRDSFILLISRFRHVSECTNVLSSYQRTPEKDVKVPVIMTIGEVAFLDSRKLIVYNMGFLPMVPTSYLEKDDEGKQFITLSYKHVEIKDNKSLIFSRSSELDTQLEILKYLLSCGGK